MNESDTSLANKTGHFNLLTTYHLTKRRLLIHAKTLATIFAKLIGLKMKQPRREAGVFSAQNV
jgi:hypothetical protein